MTKRDLGEPWRCLDRAGNDLVDTRYSRPDNCADARARIAAYSQAFHDIEDPVEWRAVVGSLLKLIETNVDTEDGVAPTLLKLYVEEVRSLENALPRHKPEIGRYYDDEA